MILNLRDCEWYFASSNNKWLLQLLIVFTLYLNHLVADWLWFKISWATNDKQFFSPRHQYNPWIVKVSWKCGFLYNTIITQFDNRLAHLSIDWIFFGKVFMAVTINRGSRGPTKDRRKLTLIFNHHFLHILRIDLEYFYFFFRPYIDYFLRWNIKLKSISDHFIDLKL